jgi:hypothetical protein
MAIISLGEIYPCSPSGTTMCARSSSAPASSIPSLPPKALEPGTAALCTKPGIRYAGATAEGAEVCFTLTPDRSKWVEIGFRFVRASGCPLKTGEGCTTGKTYLEGLSPSSVVEWSAFRASRPRSALRGHQAYSRTRLSAGTDIQVERSRGRRGVKGDDGYFDERVASRYDESAAEMFDPGVVEPVVLAKATSTSRSGRSRQVRCELRLRRSPLVADWTGASQRQG